MLTDIGPSTRQTPAAQQARRVERRGARRLILELDHRRLGHALQKQNRLPIAADARRIGLDDAQRERHRDRGIDDAAATFEHLAPGLGRQRMRRDDDRARRGHRRLDERLLRHHLIDDVLERRLRARLLRARTILSAQRFPLHRAAARVVVEPLQRAPHAVERARQRRLATGATGGSDRSSTLVHRCRGAGTVHS